MKAFTIGLILLVAGIAIFAVTFFRLIGGHALDEQTQVPGTLHVVIDQADRYYLWDNHWTLFDGRRVQYPKGCPDDIRVTVLDSEGGELQFVADSSKSWSIGNSSKTSVGYVDVPDAAELQLKIENLDRERIFSVSNDTMKQELWDRLGGLGIGIVIGLLGLPITLVGLMIRRRQRRLESSTAEQAGITSRG